MAYTQSHLLPPPALGFGFHRPQKNFLIIKFEPLLEHRHDTLT